MKRDFISLNAISYTGLCLDLIRNIGLIILTGLAVWLGATGIGKLTYEPQYTASSTLVVRAKGDSSTYSSLALASQMATVYGQVFQSDALAQLIAEDVQEEVSGTISCSNIRETNLLVLSTTSPNPRQAYLFINSALKNYEEVSGLVFANASLEVVQEPSIPEKPSNVSRLIASRNVMALLGMAFMAGIVILFYLFRYTVKKSSFAKHMLDGEVHGVIPFESKRVGLSRKTTKKALLLNSPLVSMDYAEAGRKAEARIEHFMRKKKQKVLLVSSVSENEGKSTVAANLALAMAEKHKKVLLIDGDFRKPAQYKVFDEQEDERKSLSDVINGSSGLQDAVFLNPHTKVWELFQFHSQSKPTELLNNSSLEQLIDSFREQMDYIIIDCSPTSAAIDAEMWMRFVDTVLLVVRQDWSDVRVINDTVDMVWQSGKDFSGFVLNAFHEEWFEGRRGYGYGYGYGEAKSK